LTLIIANSDELDDGEHPFARAKIAVFPRRAQVALHNNVRSTRMAALLGPRHVASNAPLSVLTIGREISELKVVEIFAAVDIGGLRNRGTTRAEH